jgi:hypothetical protein
MEKRAELGVVETEVGNAMQLRKCDMIRLRRRVVTYLVRP